MSIPGGRPRALLCLLVLNAGRVLQPERLVELLWEDEPPATATNVLQVHISALRRAIEPAGPPYRVLLSQSGGYVLNLTPERIDLSRFERFVQQGHQAIQRGDMELGRRHRAVPIGTQGIAVDHLVGDHAPQGSNGPIRSCRN